MVPECKYRLPCGWCDKFDKNCVLDHTKREIIPISDADIAKKANNHDNCSDAAISSKPKRCEDCEIGIAQISDSYRIKCPITCKIHDYQYICDVEKVEVYG